MEVAHLTTDSNKIMYDPYVILSNRSLESKLYHWLDQISINGSTEQPTTKRWIFIFFYIATTPFIASCDTLAPTLMVHLYNICR